MNDDWREITTKRAEKSNGNQSSALEYLGQGTLQRPRPRPDNHKAKATDLDFKAKIKD